jgi:TIR domain
MTAEGTFDLFLSYNTVDAPLVEEIARGLRTRGRKVFVDREYLIPGQQWPELLERYLGASKAVAICFWW